MFAPSVLARKNADRLGRSRSRSRQRKSIHRRRKTDWTQEEFYRSGIIDVEGHILTDLENICRGKDPREMKVLELGCVAGRVTRALAALFGEVHAADVSRRYLNWLAKVSPDAQEYIFIRPTARH